jgi:hypothetical protein
MSELLKAMQEMMEILTGCLASQMEAKTDINLKKMKAEIKTNQAKTDPTLREMKEELIKRLEAQIELKYKPIMRSFKSFKLLSSSGLISTKPGQRPFKKK